MDGMNLKEMDTLEISNVYSSIMFKIEFKNIRVLCLGTLNASNNKRTFL